MENKIQQLALELEQHRAKYAALRLEFIECYDTDRHRYTTIDSGKLASALTELAVEINEFQAVFVELVEQHALAIRNRTVCVPILEVVHDNTTTENESAVICATDPNNAYGIGDVLSVDGALAA